LSIFICVHLCHLWQKLNLNLNPAPKKGRTSACGDNFQQN
jgi:hypothetical protein